MAEEQNVNPVAGIPSQLASYEQLAQGATGNGGNTSSPFIFNPENGQLVSNPGYLNPLQQLQYALQTNPNGPEGQALIQAQAEVSNLTQLHSLVPTGELANYRDPRTGQTPPFGTTYAEIQDGQYVPVSAAQNEEVNQLKNALDALSNAYSISKSVSGSQVGLGSLLSKIPIFGGTAANALTPQYSQYQSAIQALPTSLSALPGVDLQSLFSQPGVVPTQGYNQATSQIQSALQSISGAQQPAAATATTPISPQALSPLQMPNSNPYSSTANPVLNPSQLGANARSNVGL